MPRTEEVEVLRFFETGPIEKVEAVFNIVCEKMRERTRDRGEPPGEQPESDRERKVRRRKADEDRPRAPEPAE